jgi:kynurenine formamidase
METVWSHEASRERYEGEAEFYIASLHLCGNTGTYVDAPIHRFREGADLAAYPLDRLAHLETVVVDVSESASLGIGEEILAGLQVRDRAILFRTGWSRHWGTEQYFGNNPFLERATCEALRDGGARFVGIDSLNIDNTKDKARPAHTVLLGAGIPVCEHMTNLDAVPAKGGRLHAVPIAWVGGASFPVRAYVMTG